MTEPIVPVKPGGGFEPWFGQLVSLARVDAAVNVDAPAADATVAAAGLGIDLVSLANIDMIGLSAFTVHPSVSGPAYQDNYMPYTIPSEGAALWEVVGAGDLTAEHLDAMPADSLEVGRRPANDQIARAQLNGNTLVERTCAQFGEYWASGGSAQGPALVWVTEPGSFWDCIHFWNFRALRPLRFSNVPMLIIPPGVVQDWLNFSNQFARVLERPDEFAPDVVLRSASDGVSEAVLDETASLLGLERYTGEPRIGHRWPAPMRTAPFTYTVNLDPRSWLTFERSYGVLTDVDVQLFRGTTTVRFSSPVTFRGEGKALVRISGPLWKVFPAARQLRT
jgi:hypothetical protein